MAKSRSGKSKSGASSGKNSTRTPTASSAGTHGGSRATASDASSIVAALESGTESGAALRDARHLSVRDLASLSVSLFASPDALTTLVESLDPAAQPGALSASCATCRFIDLLWRSTAPTSDDPHPPTRVLGSLLVAHLFWSYRRTLASGSTAPTGGAEAVLLAVTNCATREADDSDVVEVPVTSGGGGGAGGAKAGGGGQELTIENLAQRAAAADGAAASSSGAAGATRSVQGAPLLEMTSVTRGAVDHAVWRQLATNYPAIPRAYRGSVLALVGTLASSSIPASPTSAPPMDTPPIFTNIPGLSSSRSLPLVLGTGTLRIMADIILYALHDHEHQDLVDAGVRALGNLRDRAVVDIDPVLSLQVESMLGLVATATPAQGK